MRDQSWRCPANALENLSVEGIGIVNLHSYKTTCKGYALLSLGMLQLIGTRFLTCPCSSDVGMLCKICKDSRASCMLRLPVQPLSQACS